MIRWLVAATVVALVQVFIFPALGDIYPHLALLVVIVATMRLRWQQSLIIALWTGLLIDSFSLHSFGLFMVSHLGIWAITGWMRQAGIVLTGTAGMMFAVLLTLAWQSLLFMAIAGLQSSSLVVVSLLPVFIAQSIATLVFALPLKRSL